MQSIAFGLSAPIAFDAMLAAGDELFVGFAITVLIAFSISVRAVLIGVGIAGLVMVPAIPSANPTAVSSVFLLAILVSLIGAIWLTTCALHNQVPGGGQSTGLTRGNSLASLRCLYRRMVSSQNLSTGMAGISAFSVVVLLGFEAGQELLPIAQQTPSLLPLVVGVLIAVINMLGVGALLVLLLARNRDYLPLGLINPRPVIGALLISFGVYCGGKLLDFHWPGGELVIAGMALGFWMLARRLQISGVHRDQS